MADKMSRSERRKHKNKKGKKKSFFKIILLWIVFFVLAIGIVVGSIAIYWIATAPDLDPEVLDVPISSTLNDKYGQPFATLEIENRELVTYEELPQVLIDAVIATEDARFFEHNGIDLQRLGGAIVANIKDGFGSQGASTITHQVVENFFLSNEKQIKLKVQEQWLALLLERQYSKEEILEMYLNKIFYGNNAYGVKAAAKAYFGAELDELTLPQAAILAGLPQRPTAYNPVRNPELTAYRMDTVLSLMVRHGKITEAEANEARQVDISSLLVEPEEDSTPYGAFIDIVADEISEKVEGANIYTDGLIINTTIDTSVQDRVEFLLTDSASNPINYGDEGVQGSIVVLDTKTGAIQGVGGRRNSTSTKQLNYATTPFQPGSTIKPILSYGPSIEYNNISTYHQINDEPYTIGTHTFRNFSRNYSGWVSARTALSKSLNIPAVKLLEEVGFDNAIEFGSRLGLNMPDELVHSDALGGGELQVTPLELAGAFRAFGNEGIYNEPFAVTSIEFPDGSTLDLRPDSKPVMHDYTAYMVTDMLKDTITNGTWEAGSLNGLPVAGKTGTTNLGDTAPERWFAGYTTNYTIATFVGDYKDANNRRAGLPASVHWTIAQQMFRETLLPISEGMETADFTRPDSVVEVAVERGSNPPQLASGNTPAAQRIIELFVRGTEPKTASQRFTKLSPVTGLSASYNEESNSIQVQWNYSNDDDVSFEVSASVNGGAMQVLSTTKDTSLEISQVEPDSEYTIQVVAVSNSMKSDPARTSVTVGKSAEENSLPGVTGLNAAFIEEQSLIDVNWQYNGPEASFEVTVNGQTQVVQSMGIEVSGSFTPGETYTINVTTIGEGNSRGETASTSVTIPQGTEQEIPDTETEDEGETEVPEVPNAPEGSDEDEETEEAENPEEPEQPAAPENSDAPGSETEQETDQQNEEQ